MRAAIYDPYLDTAGGGERYVMTVAHALKKEGWDVEVFWKDPKIVRWLGERLGLDLKDIEVVNDINRGAGYDFVFWLSDGSIPTLFGRKNVLHFQTPFRNTNGRNLFNRLKFTRINSVVCNSKFTKRFIDKEYGVKSKVVYPPVSVSEFKSGNLPAGKAGKENLILFVGRFSQLQQAKRQDVLLDAFIKLQGKDGLHNWRLALVGGSEVGRTEFVDRIKERASGYPIDVLENLPFSEIKKYYAKAKIFWSASGFGVDEKKEPQRIEHFGITVVEAMAAGCVPVVLSKGGHKEIVKDEKDGVLWNTTAQLREKTLELVKNEERRKKLAKGAQEKAKKFSQTRFEREIIKLVS